MTLIQFDDQSGRRIGNAVRFVEDQANRRKPLTFQPLLQHKSTTIRFCSWSAAAWVRGSTATVTFTSGQTATATNVLLGVGPGDGWAASKGTHGWQLIGVDLTLQPGYSPASIQLFGHDANDIAHWYSITTCATATTA